MRLDHIAASDHEHAGACLACAPPDPKLSRSTQCNSHSSAHIPLHLLCWPAELLLMMKPTAAQLMVGAVLLTAAMAPSGAYTSPCCLQLRASQPQDYLQTLFVACGSCGSNVAPISPSFLAKRAKCTFSKRVPDLFSSTLVMCNFNTLEHTRLVARRLGAHMASTPRHAAWGVAAVAVLACRVACNRNAGASSFSPNDHSVSSSKTRSIANGRPQVIKAGHAFNPILQHLHCEHVWLHAQDTPRPWA